MGFLYHTGSVAVRGTDTLLQTQMFLIMKNLSLQKKLQYQQG